MSVVDWLERRRSWVKAHRMLGAFFAFAVLAGATAYNFHEQGVSLEKISDGRRAGTELNCAVATAVIVAGREVIQGGPAALPPRLEAFLLRQGYPPKKVREAAAARAALAYTRKINAGIEQATHVHARSILRRDGTLDCAELRRIVRVN